MEIIIFGTGSYAKQLIQVLNNNVKIVAVSDNNSKKWGVYWNDILIISPNEIKKHSFDYIVVASMYIEDITKGLLELGIDISKIICPYNRFYKYQDNVVEDKLFQNNRINNKIALVTMNNSGCNSRALYKEIPEFIKNEFVVDLISNEDLNANLVYDIYITTHYNIVPLPGKINIDLWHGFPIKTMGILNEIENIEKKDLYSSLFHNIGISISYSKLYTYLMSSCANISVDKFKVTGVPRNDLLVNRDSRSLLGKVANKDLMNKTIIFHVPTFRKRMSESGNIVEDGDGLEDSISEISRLNKYFEEKNIFLIIKEHAFKTDELEIDGDSNIFFMTDEILADFDIDFYEVLGSADMLITDFSSIYFDYLLLDRPIIFFATDYDVYEKNRGLLLEPYDFWAPGPKTHNSEELKETVETFLENKNYYSKEREQIRDIVHSYKDFNSSQRVWKEIYNYIKNPENKNERMIL